jgi:hypothetical protein
MHNDKTPPAKSRRRLSFRGQRLSCAVNSCAMRVSSPPVEVQRVYSPARVMGRPCASTEVSRLVVPDAAAWARVDTVRTISYESALFPPCVFPQFMYLLIATSPSLRRTRSGAVLMVCVAGSTDATGRATESNATRRALQARSRANPTTIGADAEVGCVSTVMVGRPTPPEMRTVSCGEDEPDVAPEEAQPTSAKHETSVSRSMGRLREGREGDDTYC